MLKESLSRSRVAGCVVITIGMLVNGVASSHESSAEHIPGGAPEDVDDDEPPSAAVADRAPAIDIVWDVEYVSGVLFRDVVRSRNRAAAFSRCRHFELKELVCG